MPDLARFKYTGPDITKKKIIIIKKNTQEFYKINRDDNNYKLIELINDRRK